MENKNKMYNKYEYKINIKGIKDPKIIIPILNSCVNSNITVDIRKLKSSPKVFAMITASSIENYRNTHNLTKILKIYDEIRTPKLDKIINDAIIKFVNNIKPNHSNYGKDITLTINECIKYMDTTTKAYILSKILEKNKDFYSYTRKVLAQISVSLANSNEDLENILRSFHKVLNGDTFLNIVNKLPDGINNKNIQKILKKTKKFDVCKYTENEIKKDNKKRIKLLKDIARTPSSAKNLNFSVTFSIKDIKALAPVMRFNFLQWYFKYIFRKAYWSYMRPHSIYFRNRVDNSIKSSGVVKIQVDGINETKLKELLFPVGLKKNNKVSDFMEKYKCYKKIKNGQDITGNEVKKVFGHWYW